MLTLSEVPAAQTVNVGRRPFFSADCKYPPLPSLGVGGELVKTYLTTLFVALGTIKCHADLRDVKARRLLRQADGEF